LKPMHSASKYLLQSKIVRISKVSAEPAKRPARSKPNKNLTISDCQVGCPIRRSRDRRVLSPPPGLSQSAASFIASCRQGIHQTPFSRLIRSGEGGSGQMTDVTGQMSRDGGPPHQSLAGHAPSAGQGPVGQCIRWKDCSWVSCRAPHAGRGRIPPQHAVHERPGFGRTGPKPPKASRVLSLHDVKFSAITPEATGLRPTK
jgi:hypothetical protein